MTKEQNGLEATVRRYRSLLRQIYDAQAQKGLADLIREAEERIRKLHENAQKASADSIII